MANWKDRSEVTRNIFESIRSASVLIVIVVLIFFTDFTNGLLDKYKVSQLNLGEAQINRATAITALQENADQVPRLKNQIELVRGQFEVLRSKYADAVDALRKVHTELDSANQELTRLRQSGVNTLEVATSNVDDILQQVPDAKAVADRIGSNLQVAAEAAERASASLPSSTTGSGPAAAIIFASSPTADSARNDAEKAKAKGLDGVVYLRQGRYRAAIDFSTPEAARAQIERVRSALAPDSYLVNLGSWCPKPTITAAGLRDCHI